MADDHRQGNMLDGSEKHIDDATLSRMAVELVCQLGPEMSASDLMNMLFTASGVLLSLSRPQEGYTDEQTVTEAHASLEKALRAGLAKREERLARLDAFANSGGGPAS